jgi:hypothetical protein
MKKNLKYKGRTVEVKAETYRNNETLALALVYEDGDRDVVTVNLGNGYQSESMAFLDTNNFPDIEKWIQKNGLGLPMGVLVQSGFCRYPLYTLFVNNS